MIYGFSTLASVALRLSKDNAYYGLGGLGIEAAISEVCWEKKSLFAIDTSPSYIWWSFEIVGGDVQIVYDAPDFDGGSEYYAADHLEGGENLIPNFNYPVEDLPLKMGLGIGQRVLTRYREDHSFNYWGEDDSSTHARILYAESHGPFDLCISSGLRPLPKATRLQVMEC